MMQSSRHPTIFCSRLAIRLLGIAFAFLAIANISADETAYVYLVNGGLPILHQKDAGYESMVSQHSGNPNTIVRSYYSDGTGIHPGSSTLLNDIRLQPAGSQTYIIAYSWGVANIQSILDAGRYLDGIMTIDGTRGFGSPGPSGPTALKIDAGAVGYVINILTPDSGFLDLHGTSHQVGDPSTYFEILLDGNVYVRYTDHGSLLALILKHWLWLKGKGLPFGVYGLNTLVEESPLQAPFALIMQFQSLQFLSAATATSQAQSQSKGSFTIPLFSRRPIVVNGVPLSTTVTNPISTADQRATALNMFVRELEHATSDVKEFALELLISKTFADGTDRILVGAEPLRDFFEHLLNEIIPSASRTIYDERLNLIFADLQARYLNAIPITQFGEIADAILGTRRQVITTAEDLFRLTAVFFYWIGNESRTHSGVVTARFTRADLQANLNTVFPLVQSPLQNPSSRSVIVTVARPNVFNDTFLPTGVYAQGYYYTSAGVMLNKEDIEPDFAFLNDPLEGIFQYNMTVFHDKSKPYVELPEPQMAPEGIQSYNNWYLPVPFMGMSPTNVTPAVQILKPNIQAIAFEYYGSHPEQPRLIASIADTTATGKHYDGAISTCTQTTFDARIAAIANDHGLLLYEFRKGSGRDEEVFYGAQWSVELNQHRARITNPVISKQKKELPNLNGSRLLTYQLLSAERDLLQSAFVEFGKALLQAGYTPTLESDTLHQLFWVRDAELKNRSLSAIIQYEGIDPARVEVEIRIWPRSYDESNSGNPKIIETILTPGYNIVNLELPWHPSACSLEVRSGDHKSIAFLQREVVPLNGTYVSERAVASRLRNDRLPLLGFKRGILAAGKRPALHFPFGSSKQRKIALDEYDSIRVSCSLNIPSKIKCWLRTGVSGSPESGPFIEVDGRPGPQEITLPLNSFINSTNRASGVTLVFEPKGEPTLNLEVDIKEVSLLIRSSATQPPEVAEAKTISFRLPSVGFSRANFRQVAVTGKIAPYWIPVAVRENGVADPEKPLVVLEGEFDVLPSFNGNAVLKLSRSALGKSFDEIELRDLTVSAIRNRDLNLEILATRAVTNNESLEIDIPSNYNGSPFLVIVTRSIDFSQMVISNPGDHFGNPLWRMRTGETKIILDDSESPLIEVVGPANPDPVSPDGELVILDPLGSAGYADTGDRISIADFQGGSLQTLFGTPVVGFDDGNANASIELNLLPDPQPVVPGNRVLRVKSTFTKSEGFAGVALKVPFQNTGLPLGDIARLRFKIRSDVRGSGGFEIKSSNNTLLKAGINLVTSGRWEDYEIRILPAGGAEPKSLYFDEIVFSFGKSVSFLLDDVFILKEQAGSIADQISYATWKQQQFGALTGPLVEAGGDFNLDGMPNIADYVMGLDPGTIYIPGRPHLKFSSGTTIQDEGISFEWQISNSAKDYVILVEEASSLTGPWRKVSTPLTTIELGGLTRKVAFPLTWPTSENSAFFRLSINYAPPREDQNIILPFGQLGRPDTNTLSYEIIETLQHRIFLSKSSFSASNDERLWIVDFTQPNTIRPINLNYFAHVSHWTWDTELTAIAKAVSADGTEQIYVSSSGGVFRLNTNSLTLELLWSWAWDTSTELKGYSNTLVWKVMSFGGFSGYHRLDSVNDVKSVIFDTRFVPYNQVLFGGNKIIDKRSNEVLSCYDIRGFIPTPSLTDYVLAEAKWSSDGGVTFDRSYRTIAGHDIVPRSGFYIQESGAFIMRDDNRVYLGFLEKGLYPLEMSGRPLTLYVNPDARRIIVCTANGEILSTEFTPELIESLK